MPAAGPWRPERADAHIAGETSRDRRNADIGDHFDRKRCAQNGSRFVAGDLERQQAQRDRHQAGADQGNDLGGKQVAIRAVGEN